MEYFKKYKLTTQIYKFTLSSIAMNAMERKIYFFLRTQSYNINKVESICFVKIKESIRLKSSEANEIRCHSFRDLNAGWRPSSPNEEDRLLISFSKYLRQCSHEQVGFFEGPI